jgi:hypothetical protein
MTARRRLVRPTGTLADRKREEDELIGLIHDWWLNVGTERDLARRILNAGWTRRVVVDDAMVEAFCEHFLRGAELKANPDSDYQWAEVPENEKQELRDVARAALSAALDRTDG